MMKLEKTSFVLVKDQVEQKALPNPDPEKEVLLPWKDWDCGETGLTQDPMLDQMLEQAHSLPRQKVQESLKILGPIELHSKFNFSNL